jgi:hypothetical protein
MKYNIEINKGGQMVGGYEDLKQKEATEIAKREAAKQENEYNEIYITWSRASDGQRGYLNPGGDHEITGKNWNRNMVEVD